MAVIIALQHEGVILGSIADTAAEALGELCDQYGDHIAHRVNNATAALVDADPREGGPPPPAVETGGDGGATELPGVDTDVPPEGAASPESPGDTGGSGAGAGGATEPSVEEAPKQEGATCTICNSGVPPDWAEVSLDLYGEHRCITCSDR